jgi:hypothetical protein
MRWEPRRKSCGLDYKPLENPYRLTVGRSNLPALRFRYTEENVTREPARMTMYANGTASPHQSISNMTVSSLVSPDLFLVWLVWGGIFQVIVIVDEERC